MSLIRLLGNRAATMLRLAIVSEQLLAGPSHPFARRVKLCSPHRYNWLGVWGCSSKVWWWQQLTTLTVGGVVALGVFWLTW
jgi:hypothetical protein